MKIIHFDKLNLLPICLSFLFILTKGYILEASQTEDDDMKNDRPISKASNLKDPKVNADNIEVQTTA